MRWISASVRSCSGTRSVNDNTRTYVEPLAQQIEAPLFLPLDVGQPQQLEAVFAAIERRWGRLDILVHSLAFAPKAASLRRLIWCIEGLYWEGSHQVVTPLHFG